MHTTCDRYTKTIERLFGNTFKTYLQGLLRAGVHVCACVCARAILL